MLVLSTRIVLDCFYLLIFYSEKFSTDVRRLPYAVNVNLNLSIFCETGITIWLPPKLEKLTPTSLCLYFIFFFVSYLPLCVTKSQ